MTWKRILCALLDHRWPRVEPPWRDTFDPDRDLNPVIDEANRCLRCGTPITAVQRQRDAA